MPTDEDDLRVAAGELAGLLLGDENLDDTLLRVAQIACRAVPACTDAGVTLVRDGRRIVSVHTNPDAGGVSMAIPLVVRGEIIGELTLHADKDYPFDEGATDLLSMLADQAATVAANALAHDSAVTLAQQLADAMTSRAVIEQAKGVLMARERCNPDDAFDMLRRASQRSNTKLRDIAQQIVDSVTRSETPGSAG
jgi:transcriptional regulator with GAF, ATPase, and Fis domain